jgi:hypothetical protein
MTATPYAAESFGMQQMQRRYGASATRIAKATSHEPGHEPVHVTLGPVVGDDWITILAGIVRQLPPDRATNFLEDAHAAVREAAMFAVCAQEAK